MTHQEEILLYLKSVESATKKDIYTNVKFGYYHNWQKHLGDVLTRMVRNGTIERVKRGVYQFKRNKPVKDSVFYQSQPNLFN